MPRQLLVLEILEIQKSAKRFPLQKRIRAPGATACRTFVAYLILVAKAPFCYIKSAVGYGIWFKSPPRVHSEAGHQGAQCERYVAA